MNINKLLITFFALFLTTGIIKAPRQDISGMNPDTNLPLSVEELTVKAQSFLNQAVVGDKLVIGYPRAFITYIHPENKSLHVYEKPIKRGFTGRRSHASQTTSDYYENQDFSAQRLSNQIHDAISHRTYCYNDETNRWGYKRTGFEPLDQNEKVLMDHPFFRFHHQPDRNQNESVSITCHLNPWLVAGLSIPFLIAGGMTTLKNDYEKIVAEHKKKKTTEQLPSFGKYLLKKTFSMRNMSKHKIWNTGRFLGALSIYIAKPQPFNSAACSTATFCKDQAIKLWDIIK